MENTKSKGGRPKGAKNKQSLGARIARLKAGITPLDFLLNIMRDTEAAASLRFEAAKAAAPYCHARLQSVTVQEKPFEGDPNEFSNEYLAGIIARAGSRDADAEAPGSNSIN
jgi:hypothetical protein